VLVTELEQAGAIVDEVAAYTTVAAAGDDEQGREVLHLLQNGQIDIITFTSSSTVRNFIQWLTSCVGESEIGDLPGEESGREPGEEPGREPGDEFGREPEEEPGRHGARSSELKIACIGPITSQTAREFGLKVDIEAREFTIDGLVEAIVQSEDRLT